MLNLRLIGASDLPYLAGLSNRRSPVELYNRIVHDMRAPETAWMEEAGRLGNLYEFPTAIRACEKLGIDAALLEKLDSIERPGGLRWARCSPDPGIPRLPFLTECKMRVRWRLDEEGWGEPGTGQVPPAIFAQVQAQMAFLRADRDRWVGTDLPDLGVVHVVVGVDGQSVRIYPVRREPDIGAALLELGERFWVDHVERQRPPPWDGSEGAARALAARYPRAGADVRPARKGEARTMAAYQRAKARADAAAKRAERLKQRLCAAIGDGLGLEAPGLVARWPERKGRPDQGAIAAELAARLDLSPAEFKALEEAHRGRPYRFLEVKAVKPHQEE